MALVSVLMPVYNADDYLDATLNSLATQTFDDFEVLMVDDGSEDKSSEICKQWSSSDSRFKYRRQNNAGGGVARNTAIDWAFEGDSEYIAWVDADDIVSPRYLEALVGVAEEHACDIVQCRFTSFCDGEEDLVLPAFSESMDGISVLDGYQLEKRLLDGGVDSVVLWNKLWKKTLFNDIRVVIRKGLSGRINNDENIIWKLYLKSSSAISLSMCLYGYRIHAGSVQHVRTKARVLEAFEIWKDRWDFYHSNSYGELESIASEKILHTYAHFLSKPKEDYEDWPTFVTEARESYDRARYATCEAKRVDLVLLRAVTKYWFGFFRVYGLLYRCLRSK